ncbi:Actin-related protein 2/3 complex subunit 4 [Seminavis robusta]|uniref:Actin-related protein 2/3 complex subunit 4 n=1 Tax=Seminavis robusta TaxID=568900 RepID=A0A9N8DWV3_9STRA|nr:Actin-related protein 2/3 complex subunit 4 [Seminavis robusta]|eukprot:Sro307_g113250.1 Actin-related protein 2/3 complex subunit 4 (170) ;mRNA; f:27822-28331
MTTSSFASRKDYLDSIEKGLREGLTAMDIDDKASAVPRRYKAFFEDSSHRRVVLWKAPMKECCLLEATSDSIRCSFRLKKQDELETIIVREFLTTQQQLWKDYRMLQKIPLEGHDVSFFITNRQVRDYGLEEVVASIVAFVTSVEKEKSDMKIGVNARARQAARGIFGN